MMIMMLLMITTIIIMIMIMNTTTTNNNDTMTMTMIIIIMTTGIDKRLYHHCFNNISLISLLENHGSRKAGNTCQHVKSVAKNMSAYTLFFLQWIIIYSFLCPWNEIFVTGCTGCCLCDNFRCSQWQNFRQINGISVSVMEALLVQHKSIFVSLLLILSHT